jgi:phage-related baseplate assembly protein
VALAPTIVNFDVTLNVTLLSTADVTIVTAAINAAMNTYRILLYSGLGLDVVIKEMDG